MITTTRMAIVILLLAFWPHPARQQPSLALRATPSVVVWSGAHVGGCVYRIEPDRTRVRLGCSYTNSLDIEPGLLWEDDLVEVRRPVPSGVLTGRAIVGP